MRALASNLEASRTFEAPFPLKMFRTKRRPWPEGPSVAANAGSVQCPDSH